MERFGFEVALAHLKAGRHVRRNCWELDRWIWRTGEETKPGRVLIAVSVRGRIEGEWFLSQLDLLAEDWSIGE